MSRAKAARAEAAQLLKEARKVNDAQRQSAPTSWLQKFEAMARSGLVAHEPDFPKALEMYRSALAAAGPDKLCSCRSVQLVNGVEVPRGTAERGVIVGTIQEQRCQACEAKRWLLEIALRATNRIPPVTEEEFEQLRQWISDPGNLRRVQKASPDGHGMVQFSWGSMSAFNVLFQMRKGPREFGAGEAAQAVRWLKQQYGEEQPPPH
jgi:hypothetical protein